MENMPLMRSIRLTSKTWARWLRRIAAEAGIPDSYRPVLMFLSRCPGSSQKELAEELMVSGAAVSQIVRDMQREDYLYREPRPGDQRQTALYLTQRGLDAADCLRRALHEADAVITSAVTPEKEAQITDFLEDLRNLIEKEL